MHVCAEHRPRIIIKVVVDDGRHSVADYKSSSLVVKLTTVITLNIKENNKLEL